ncbi:MAG: dihydroneopterin aldolase [Flavobacteriales bacterium]|nr:dihydroneopterin aldolase [Flavobacteriales bacterium]
MTHRIEVNGIRSFAYHGCMAEEALTGTYFLTDISLTTDFTTAATNDSIDDTVNYARLHEIVEQEMAIRSAVIENVALRIYNAIKKTYPQIMTLSVRVAKQNPPMGGVVREAAATIAD